jgi:hypothetical protein
VKILQMTRIYHHPPQCPGTFDPGPTIINGSPTFLPIRFTKFCAPLPRIMWVKILQATLCVITIVFVDDDIHEDFPFLVLLTTRAMETHSGRVQAWKSQGPKMLMMLRGLGVAAEQSDNYV